MEKQSQSQSPLSARRAYDEIVTRLPGTSWEFASTLSKKGQKGLHKEIKVTGGLSYNLALLTNNLFGITTLNVITRYCIDHRGYFRWFLQQNLSIEVKWRDGTFWLQFTNITHGNWVKLSLRGFRFLLGFFKRNLRLTHSVWWLDHGLVKVLWFPNDKSQWLWWLPGKTTLTCTVSV